MASSGFESLVSRQDSYESPVYAGLSRFWHSVTGLAKHLISSDSLFLVFAAVVQAQRYHLTNNEHH
jgi:hypothetical protein